MTSSAAIDDAPAPATADAAPVPPSLRTWFRVHCALDVACAIPLLLFPARALGLPPRARLRMIELPLAMPFIVAGIKTSAVIAVGTATVGALVGAGGFGQPILTGIRLDDFGLILQGAVPAAVMALALEALLGAVERRVVPRGLRPPR